MSITISFYDNNAQQCFEQYTATNFEAVHGSWKAFWPLSKDRVLDVGAGTGRDALWMAEQHCDVFAVEPAEAMRKIGQKHTGTHVTWIDDSLPSLSKVINLGFRFDLILVSAVWMHIAPSHRERAFRKLSNLLAPNGRLVISLRHGDFNDTRQSYKVSGEELEQLAKDSALIVRHVSSMNSDSLNRDDVTWQTVVMSLPDDGSGDLTKIRHIVVNDNKAATYKLALLRTLLRIADAHSGSVVDRTDGKVAIPLGLVALYWIRQFKRLIDIGDIQQNSNPNKGLGFIKPDGWHKLKHIGVDDLSVGSIFVGDEAKALQETFKDTLDTIIQNPVKFTYIGDKQNCVFSVTRKTKRKKKNIVLDRGFFESYGYFILDESLWECLRLFHSWIEPLVVNQWVIEMQKYSRNQARNISLQTYYDYLVWVEKDHDTRAVRKRVDQITQQQGRVESVWSGQKLQSTYQIDHCLPFVYWPNNDRWNLLPSTAAENNKKSNRVPSQQRLQDSKTRIVEWWTMAWLGTESEDRFFQEACLSLPNVSPQCRDFEEVFEAMNLQIRGVKSRLLINEWL
ncbi:class I SAM-dependent methyltransferase [Vibrio sp. YMD68]|uniref:class I SAM-dependent methyltransferase n=1 Tax=Vibrio sp. YMD68 TaxID=3042300 RepID=UPI00249C3F3C|nr:class I SAM-dependent methyltransferase [Vibrio sp. YMD68]WGW01779.1 class I SAM-dependent methyltransferase [Vibrio sp. YMD68]